MIIWSTDDVCLFSGSKAIMNISPWQDQIICGSLLGNGYVYGDSPYFGMSETRDFNWISYKQKELQEISSKVGISDTGSAWKWRSRCDLIFSHYRQMFYKEGKKSATMKILDPLKDTALAVWFGDKGFWYTNQCIGLRSSAFYDSNNVLRQYLNEVGFDCRTKEDSNGATRIVFSKKGTENFLSTIAHRLPTFMHYRLGP